MEHDAARAAMLIASVSNMFIYSQEKRIRAQQSMKQLSKRMTEQRVRTLEHLRAGMTPGKVRILPRDVEQGLKEFAGGVEQLVDRLVWILSLPTQSAS